MFAKVSSRMYFHIAKEYAIFLFLGFPVFVPNSFIKQAQFLSYDNSKTENISIVFLNLLGGASIFLDLR